MVIFGDLYYLFCNGQGHYIHFYKNKYYKLTPILIQFFSTTPMQASVSEWNSLLCYLLLLIILLSLKEKVCYILHSNPIYSTIALFAPPFPQSYRVLVLELQAR